MTLGNTSLLLIALLAGGPAMALEISSTAFGPGAAIPGRYTCEGDDVSPPLHWQGVPAGARSLVLIVDDPDAPDPRAPKMTWVHWVLVNLPVDAAGLAEGIAPAALPEGTVEGLNDWKRTGYGGPCPPIGRHRYFHKLYALDVMLDGLKRPTKAQVEAAMQGHVLAHAELVGRYEKTGR
ncbi:MAG: YbhB/YbcL family Raf kinase inhibitor-like protein [Steroidobacteraceae bacterium]